jgi:hypothetical protein
MAGARAGGRALDNPAAAWSHCRRYLDHHPASPANAAGRHRGPQPGDNLDQLDRPPDHHEGRPDDLDHGRVEHDHHDHDRRRHDHDQLRQHRVVVDHDLDD